MAGRENGRERLDYKVFRDIMTALAALYPRYDLTKDTLSAYYAILHDLPAELLRAATVEYGSTDTPWFPSAGQLRQTAFELLERASGKVTAEEAWGLVIQAASTVGHRREPEFDEPLIHEAIEDVGGWRHICLGPFDTLHTTRARFIQAYKQRLKQERATMRMLPQVREAALALTAGERPQSDGILPIGVTPRRELGYDPPV